MTAPRPDTPGTSALVAEALSLRRWALRLLGGAPTLLPPCSCAALQLFLRVEGCALAIRAAGDHHLTDQTRPILLARATREQKQFLAASAQARRLGRWAEARGERVIVLKGGVAAVRGGPQVGMADLDVLAEGGAASDLADFLDSEFGFKPLFHDSGAGHHLPQRTSPGLLMVEVHRRLKELGDLDEALRRAIPLGRPGVWSLAPEDHLRHLVLHATISHRERRGRIRDLLLIADAWERLDGAGEGVEDGLDESAAAMLRMAQQLSHGIPPGDPFEAEAAARYLLAILFRPSLNPKLARDLSNSTFALLAGRGDYLRCWDTVFGPPGRRIWKQPGAAGRPTHIAWRAARLAMMGVPAAVVALRASRVSRG